MASRILHQNLRRGSDNPVYYYAKRAVDIVFVSIALTSLSPLLIAVGFLIKLTSPGPLFFTQKRMGARRRVINDAAGRSVIWEPVEFSLYKFRTTFHNVAQSIYNESIAINPDGPATPLGRTLQRLCIDELPQIINILSGEMSIVGPRPLPPCDAELSQEIHLERLTVLPGLTNLWQVEGCGRTDFNSMVAFDIRYVRTCSMWLDIKIMLLTIRVAILGPEQ